MESTEYQKMAEMEERYWWYIGRQHIIRKQLRNIVKDPEKTRILNVGSGTGATIPLLERYGKVTNVEVSDDAIEYAKSRGVETVKVKGIKLPFKANSFDLVVAFDVLEHIEDDRGALKEWNRVLSKGGKVMITVPAHEWLWSSHDESLHHYRRYTVSEMHRKFNRAGFNVIKRTYAITFSFPLIVGYRFLNSFVSRRQPKKTSHVMLPRPINWFFSSLLRVEGSLLEHMNMPVGTSVLMIGEKE